jgi:LmbE family N-acetylglucosaminyl deacetylase
MERALAIVAHPDDVDFVAAGTVANWTEAGIEVAYCVVTDGDAGGFDPSVPRAEIPGIRRAEQTAAAMKRAPTALSATRMAGSSPPRSAARSRPDQACAATCAVPVAGT